MLLKRYFKAAFKVNILIFFFLFSFFNSLGTMSLTFRFSSLIPQMQTKPLEIWLCSSARYDFIILFHGIIDKQINSYWSNTLYLVKIQNRIKVLINKGLEMQRQAKSNDKNRHFGVFMTALSRRSKNYKVCGKV